MNAALLVFATVLAYTNAFACIAGAAAGVSIAVYTLLFRRPARRVVIGVIMLNAFVAYAALIDSTGLLHSNELSVFKVTVFVAMLSGGGVIATCAGTRNERVSHA